MLIKTNKQLKVNSEAIEEFSDYNYNEKHETDGYVDLGSITLLFGAFNVLDICHLQVEDKKAYHVCKYSAKRNHVILLMFRTPPLIICFTKD